MWTVVGDGLVTIIDIAAAEIHFVGGWRQVAVAAATAKACPGGMRSIH